jgi:hypothetical protein
MWTDYHEQLLINWAEQSSGHSLLHYQTMQLYTKRNWYIAIPASILGYVAGLTVFFSDGDETYSDVIRGLIGVSSFAAGILTNMQQLFTYQEKAERHRIASLQFFSFLRDISTQLSLEPVMRVDAKDYIFQKKDEFEKIIKHSPSIPQTIIEKFNVKFKDVDIHKPQIVGVLSTILPYKILQTLFDERFREQNTTLTNRSNNSDSEDTAHTQNTTHTHIETLRNINGNYMKQLQERGKSNLVDIVNADKASIGATEQRSYSKRKRKNKNKTPNMDYDEETSEHIAIDIKNINNKNIGSLNSQEIDDDDSLSDYTEANPIQADENLINDSKRSGPNFFKNTFFFELQNRVLD